MAGTRRRRVGQGTVYRRKDGRWGWGVTVGYNERGNPKRLQGTANTQREAVEELNRAIADLSLGVPEKASRQRLAEFLDYWLKEFVRGKKAPLTESFYERQCRLHIMPAIGHVELRGLTAQQVQAFFNRLAEKGLSPTSVGHVRATLRAALQTAHRLGLVRDNVVKRTEPPRIARREPSHLTAEECARLLQACEGHYLGALVRLALNTGLRLGEATGLRWSDVAPDFSQLAVRVQLQRVGGRFVLREPKSASSLRTLPLTAAARAALQRQRADQMLWASMAGGPFNELGLVFTGLEGRPLDHRNVNRHLAAFARKAGLTKRVSFHTLRHTAATHLVASGVPLNVAKEILGHSHVALTANLYAHAVPAAHRAAFDMLERAYENPA